MKIRTGFVANSSSSSFIIAYKEIPKIIVDNQPDWIKSLISKSVNELVEASGRYCEESSKIVSTVKALDEYFKDQHCWSTCNTLEQLFEEEPHYKEDYDEYKTAIEQGYKICFREVDYCNEWLSDFFESLPKKDDGKGMYLIKTYS